MKNLKYYLGTIFFLVLAFLGFRSKKQIEEEAEFKTKDDGLKKDLEKIQEEKKEKLNEKPTDKDIVDFLNKL